MLGPTLVGWLMAGLMGVTGLYCLGRTLRPGAAGAERALDGSEALKGLGMAVMAVPYGLGRAVPVGVWVLLFGGAALWSLGAGLRTAAHPERTGGGHPGQRGHHLFHGVGHLAMVYTAVAMARAGGAGAMGDMAGMAGGAGVPLLTDALLLFFGSTALLTGVRLISTPGVGAGLTRGGTVTGRLLGAPQLPHACRMVLGLGMFTMLLTV